MRDSQWRITWDPQGESPRVLLDFGDPMDAEMARYVEQLVDVGAPDFAVSGIPAARGNRRGRLEFGRRIGHDSAAASWEACSRAIAGDPWGVKGVLRVKPQSGLARYYQAALSSSSHRPAADFATPESVHSYVFRVGSAQVGTGEWVPAGPPVTVTGGTYNPVTGDIVLTVPDPGAYPPGSHVEVAGVPGIPDGVWQVKNNSGGVVTVQGPEAEEPEPEALDPAVLGPMGYWSNGSCMYQLRFTIDIQVPAGGGWSGGWESPAEFPLPANDAERVVGSGTTWGQPLFGPGNAVWSWPESGGLHGVTVAVPDDEEVTGEPFVAAESGSETPRPWDYSVIDNSTFEIYAAKDGKVLRVKLRPAWSSQIIHDVDAPQGSVTREMGKLTVNFGGGAVGGPALGTVPVEVEFDIVEGEGGAGTVTPVEQD